MRVPLFHLICVCICAKVTGDEVCKSSGAKALFVSLPSGRMVIHYARGFVCVGVCVHAHACGDIEVTLNILTHSHPRLTPCQPCPEITADPIYGTFNLNCTLPSTAG